MTEAVLWPFFEVQFRHLPKAVYNARDEKHAQMQALNDYTKKTGIRMTIEVFRLQSRTNGCRQPKYDRYDLVRRRYNLFPRLGQRLRLHRENLAVKGGVVMYPPDVNPNYLLVLLDDSNEPLRIDPALVELLDP